uniref:Uncharacterized protein n=1 Tax=Bracon brevicornis TaxID=1563983 RepID=A0A6V7KVK5_9HYME
MGDSHYRYKNKIYTSHTGSQKLYYYFQKKEETQQPAHTGGAYEKIKRGNFMLSPDALWKIKLTKVVNGMWFDHLKTFKSEIDLELNGRGHYVNDDEDKCSDLDVDEYYEADDVLENYNRIKHSGFAKKED